MNFAMIIPKKLEIWYVSTDTYVASENIPLSTKAFLILLMSAFFLQKMFYFQFLCDRRILLMKFKFYRLCVQNPGSGLLQIANKLEK